MVASISPTSINTVAFLHSRPVLSKGTIAELKELGINISSISSEAQARRIIEEKTNAKEIATESQQNSDKFANIYQRLKTLCMKLDISFSSGEKIENVLSKIQAKISLFERNNNNANISAIRAEYDSIKYSYETIAISEAASYTGLDILGFTNKAVMNINGTKK